MDDNAVANDADDVLDSLIAVHQELMKRGDARRQHADATGATLMTTAVALGAALVATANALEDAAQIPETAAYVALGGLVATLVFGAAARASVLQKLRRTTSPLWDTETILIAELRDLAETAGYAYERGPEDPDRVLAALGKREIKAKSLLLWRTTSEIRDRTVRFKNDLLFCGGLSLAVALGALVVIGVSIFLDSYP
jgi:hypothetical protein